MKLTRRQLAAVVSAAAIADAQTTQRPAGAADAMETARQRLKASADALAHEPVPMDIEPAFQFKA